jgi:hypothetical protein
VGAAQQLINSFIFLPAMSLLSAHLHAVPVAACGSMCCPAGLPRPPHRTYNLFNKRCDPQFLPGCCGQPPCPLSAVPMGSEAPRAMSRHPCLMPPTPLPHRRHTSHAPAVFQASRHTESHFAREMGRWPSFDNAVT